MFKVHNTRSRLEGDLAPKRSPSRARLLGAGLAITVAAIGGGAYASTAAYAGGSGHPYTSDYAPYGADLGPHGGDGAYGGDGGWGADLRPSWGGHNAY
jgi:hypothetical protein